MTGVDMRSRDLCSRFQETACSPEALEAHREIPDESLVQRGIEGDKEALEILFARQARAAYRRAFQLLRNREDAEDAVQEGLLSAYRNLPQFQHRSQFSTWFTRIVINASLMQLRRRRQRAGTISLDEDQQEDSTTLATVVADPGPSPEQIYAGAESRSILENSIKDLPQFLRPALEFRYLVGLSCQETARALSLSEGSVKAYLHRGRLKLAHRMKESASHRHQDCLPTRQLPGA